MFVKYVPAKELGKLRASINRTGKTTAAKGVPNHCNEYKDFHSKEVEAHIHVLLLWECVECPK